MQILTTEKTGLGSTQNVLVWFNLKQWIWICADYFVWLRSSPDYFDIIDEKVNSSVSQLVSFRVVWSGLDNWLNLTRVDPDEEVQGEIHLSVVLLKDTEKINLRCQIIEAR